MPLDLPDPDVGKLNPHFILGEIIDHVHALKDDHPEINVDELRQRLIDVRNHQVDPEQQIRGLIKVFENAPAFKDSFAQLDADTQTKVKAFASGKKVATVIGTSPLKPKISQPVEQRFHLSDFLSCFTGKKDAETDGDALPAARPKVQKKSTTADSISRSSLPIVYEDAEEKNMVDVYSSLPFENWGLSVSNTPLWTFVPTKLLGLQNIIKWAKAEGRRVRCSGYRHSWAPIFSQNGEILISMIPIKQATVLPDPSVIEPTPLSNKTNDFKTIEIARPIAGQSLPDDKGLVRIGSAVTTEELRRFLVADGNWALPMDVILGEVTVGGTNGSICHGGGHRHKTINDQVRQIEYVDVNGVHRTISDPAQLKAAAGCFGLLGVVTHVTYQVDKMTYAVMKPKKVDTGLAIPPLKREHIPLALQKTFTDAQLAAAAEDFSRRANEDYYSEWFWFAYQSTVWLNTWNPVTDPIGFTDYTSPVETFIQWVETWLGGVITSSKFYQVLPGRWQAQLLATATMLALPPTTFDKQDLTIKCQLPNALHFRRDDQGMRVRDMEIELPIPSDATDPSKPDFSIVRKAWWDVINLVYSRVDSPLRLCMELRIMANSDLIMAPQRGNKHGTASIEVLTIPSAVPHDEWVSFLQQVVDMWGDYVIDGEKKPIRPHWAKEWNQLTIANLPARQYLKTVSYKDAIPEFKSILASIGKEQGWTLADLKEIFSNELWDEVIFSD